MAIKLPSTSATVKVILRQDSALNSDIVTDEVYEKYLETNDESLLTFVEGQQPTRFVMRKVLRFDAAQAVQNQQTRMVGNKIEMQIGYILEEVRQSLTDVENPEGTVLADMIIFKRDADGGASKELVEALHAMGAVMNLFSARQNANSGLSESLKKKSVP